MCSLVSAIHVVFSDILEQNNDYSDAHDFRREWVGKVGVVTFFILEVPDYKFAMLIYLYIFIHMWPDTTKGANFHKNQFPFYGNLEEVK